MLDTESGLVEITSRTLHGLFLCRPSPEVNDRILGVLGRAQAKYKVEIHVFSFMSNHFHLIISVRSVKQMARFVGFLKANLAKELGELHDWKVHFWGRRYHSASIGDVESIQIERFVYVLENGCKEGLVASPLDWPGVSSANALYHGETKLTGTWFDRTAEHRSGQRGEGKLCPSTETVHLTPMPFLQGLSAEEQRQFVQETVHRIEQETAQRHQENGTKPLGVRAILRQKPHAKPKELKASPAPLFHAANREEFWAMYNARHAKEAAYSAAAERLKRGETDVRFPDGCFPPPLPFVETRAPP